MPKQVLQPNQGFQVATSVLFELDAGGSTPQYILNTHPVSCFSNILLEVLRCCGCLTPQTLAIG